MRVFLQRLLYRQTSAVLEVVRFASPLDSRR